MLAAKLLLCSTASSVHLAWQMLMNLAGPPQGINIQVTDSARSGTSQHAEPP